MEERQNNNKKTHRSLTMSQFKINLIGETKRFSLEKPNLISDMENHKVVLKTLEFKNNFDFSTDFLTTSGLLIFPMLIYRMMFNDYYSLMKDFCLLPNNMENTRLECIKHIIQHNNLFKLKIVNKKSFS